MIPINVPVLKLHSSFSSITSSQYRLLSWFGYNICFCKSAWFISALIFSHKLIDFAVVAVLITYLTDSPWNCNLRKAARLVNIQEGLSSSLVILMTCISDAFFGRLKIIIFSSISYVLGLVLLCITAFEEDANFLFKMLLVIGIVLLAVGQAGMKPCLGAFLADQLRAHEPKFNKNEDRVMARKRIWWLVSLLFSVIASTQLTGWRVIFTFTAAATGICLFMFLLGIRFFDCKETTGPGCSFTVIFRVVKAALSKRHLKKPSSSKWLFRNDTNQIHLSPRIKFGRWLDKAAVIESSSLSPQEQEVAGRLCTVAQVKDTKLVLKMVPIWTTFVVFGLVVSTGQTFFPEQGDDLNPQGYVTYFIVFQVLCRTLSSYLYEFLLSKWIIDPKQKQAQIVRIWAGMALSTICCAVAWRVEVHRLIIINNKGLQDESNKEIPMSIFWLAPQYCLLGLMQGLAGNGIDEFLIDQFPEPMRDYVSAITEFVIGFASFVNIIGVHVNKSLFADLLNRSRLDQYYMKLTVVSFINVCYFWWVSNIYTDSDTEEDERSKATSGSKDEDVKVPEEDERSQAASGSEDEDVEVIIVQ